MKGSAGKAVEGAVAAGAGAGAGKDVDVQRNASGKSKASGRSWWGRRGSGGKVPTEADSKGKGKVVGSRDLPGALNAEGSKRDSRFVEGIESSGGSTPAPK